MNLTELSDDELANLRLKVLTEQERRHNESTLPETINTLAETYLAATGREPGQKWVQPTGAHNAYPTGWVVEHDGNTWVNLTPANVWEPGVSGWRAENVEGAGPPEYVPPTGAHDAYMIGDRVTFEGARYESVVDNNTWSPADYPAGWRKLE